MTRAFSLYFCLQRRFSSSYLFAMFIMQDLLQLCELPELESCIINIANK